MVITATLGERDSLKKTIDSVRTIGRDDVRHVLVCPQNRIQTIKNRFGDIECLAEPEGRKGIYAALNYGFNKYGRMYKYLTFINDDDCWLPDFRKLIIKIKDNPELDLVYGRTQYINSHGELIGHQTCSNQFKDFIPLLLSNIVMLTQQSTLIKSSLFFEIGGYDESYLLVSDSKFWAQLSMMHIKYKYMNLECAQYMVQSGQLSSNKELQRIEGRKLRGELIKIKSPQLFASLLYRMYNIPIYLSRIFERKKLNNPFEDNII